MKVPPFINTNRAYTSFCPVILATGKDATIENYTRIST